jgi:ribosomal protein L12E/L44/L45/RPP1/RPP2
LFVPELIEELLQRAQLNALALNGAVHPEQAVKPAPKAEEKKEEAKEEEEEEKTDEEVAAGLSGLFG